jgi:hypothetical protein
LSTAKNEKKVELYQVSGRKYLWVSRNISNCKEYYREGIEALLCFFIL